MLSADYFFSKSPNLSTNHADRDKFYRALERPAKWCPRLARPVDIPKWCWRSGRGVYARTRRQLCARLESRSARFRISGHFAVYYLVDLGDKGFFGFGKGNHIPHDFAFSFISHFMPGKQHNRRFPDASMSQAFSIRRRRVSGCLAVLIEKIQSRRAIGVISAQDACAGGAAAKALRRSMGTLVSGSSSTRVISTVTVSPASAPAASCMAWLTLSQ